MRMADWLDLFRLLTTGSRKLDAIYRLEVELNAKLDQILQGAKTMAADLSTLEAQVAANTQVEASAVALIQGIAAQLAAAATDPAKVQALIDQLNGSAANLAAAITANTPATATT